MLRPSCLCLCTCLWAPVTGPVWWGTEGKVRSNARVSTRAKSNPDIASVSEMGVRTTVTVGRGLGNPGLSFPIQPHPLLAQLLALAPGASLSHRGIILTALLSTESRKTCSSQHVQREEYPECGLSQVPSVYWMPQLVHNVSHGYWQYPASLQVMSFYCKIHCCEACICQIKR